MHLAPLHPHFRFQHYQRRHLRCFGRVGQPCSIIRFRCIVNCCATAQEMCYHRHSPWRCALLDRTTLPPLVMFHAVHPETTYLVASSFARYWMLRYGQWRRFGQQWRPWLPPELHARQITAAALLVSLPLALLSRLTNPSARAPAGAPCPSFR